MPLEPPTKADWESWRPTLICWYKTRTADSIAEQLKNEHGLNVTSKMLRDRFKQWNGPRKYNRHQTSEPRRRKRRANEPDSDAPGSRPTGSFNLFIRQHPSSTDGPSSTEGLSSNPILLRTQSSITRFNTVHRALLTPPSRTPDTPKENVSLQQALSEVCGYLDRIVDSGSWMLRLEKPAFELQKLVAQAHMCISSQSHDSHHIWRELKTLSNPLLAVIPSFGESNLLTMHPRSLTAILRVLVDSVSFGEGGSKTLENVKYMFWAMFSHILQASHPLRLLCSVPKKQSIELLFRLIKLMDQRLYLKIGNNHPDGAVFVAQEQTYAARVLASLGYSQWAESKLRTIIDDLDSHNDLFTKADAYRTLGYMKEQSCVNLTGDRLFATLNESQSSSAKAIDLFKKMGMGYSNEAMFTVLSLSQTNRMLGDLESAERYLVEAINIWKTIRSDEDQGGSKLILDLHKVLCDQNKLEEARLLRESNERYFEESRLYYEDQDRAEDEGAED